MSWQHERNLRSQHFRACLPACIFSHRANLQERCFDLIGMGKTKPKKGGATKDADRCASARPAGLYVASASNLRA